MEIWLQQLLDLLALPQFGLSTVFVVAFISATLLPLGSEPAVFGLVKLNPELFWPAVLVATAGNTLGGAVSWWMGLGARKAWYAARERRRAGQPPQDAQAPRELSRTERRARVWLRLPFWPCVMYMAIGKLARYTVMTAGLLHLVPGAWTP